MVLRLRGGGCCTSKADAPQGGLPPVSRSQVGGLGVGRLSPHPSVVWRSAPAFTPRDSAALHQRSAPAFSMPVLQQRVAFAVLCELFASRVLRVVGVAWDNMYCLHVPACDAPSRLTVAVTL